MASPDPPTRDAEFDAYSEDYDAQLQKGLSLTGEDKNYFAEGRMRWVKKRLAEIGVAPQNAHDFGCGTGGSFHSFFDVLGVDHLTGTDPSEESISIAAREHDDLGERLKVATPDKAEIAGGCDLAFCNGVFHHIPIEDRNEAVQFVFESLRPGGVFAFWENNAWNPATRYVMSRVPFDRDAILLFPHGAREMLRAGGFEILGTDYLFIFPKVLAALRPLEPALCRFPLGGQYLVLAQKPLS